MDALIDAVSQYLLYFILAAAAVVWLYHSVERPAAPVTTFLLGLAVAGGMDVSEAAARIQALAETWPPSAG